MEKELEHLLCVLTECLSIKTWETVFSKIAKLVGLPLSTSEDRVKVANWVHENYHELYLKAQKTPSVRGWIFTLEELEERLKVSHVNSID